MSHKTINDHDGANTSVTGVTTDPGATHPGAARPGATHPAQPAPAPPGSTPMYWSHADADASRGWIRDAGLVITSEETIPEGNSAHALFWAQRPGPARPAEAAEAAEAAEPDSQ